MSLPVPLLLLQHPEQMQALQGEHSLVADCIAKVLRIKSSGQGLYRTKKVDTDQFPFADHSDIQRANAKENLDFVEGIHYSLGAALARIEAKYYFEMLLIRLQNIRLAADKNDPARTLSFILRRLKALQLECDQA